MFKHRLINHFRVEPAGLRMSGRGDPILYDLLKFHRGHARVRGHDEFEERVVAAGERGFVVSLENRSERFPCFPFGMPTGKRLHAVEREIKLHWQRLFAPERAVIVKRGDALRHRHEVRRAGCGNLRDKRDDRPLGFAVVPRWQRIAGTGAEGECQCRQRGHGDASDKFHDERSFCLDEGILW